MTQEQIAFNEHGTDWVELSHPNSGLVFVFPLEYMELSKLTKYLADLNAVLDTPAKVHAAVVALQQIRRMYPKEVWENGACVARLQTQEDPEILTEDDDWYDNFYEFDEELLGDSTLAKIRRSNQDLEDETLFVGEAPVTVAEPVKEVSDNPRGFWLKVMKEVEQNLTDAACAYAQSTVGQETYLNG